MPVTHGVASSSLVQTANPNRESLSPNGWGIFAFPLCLPQCFHDLTFSPFLEPSAIPKDRRGPLEFLVALDQIASLLQQDDADCAFGIPCIGTNTASRARVLN